MIVSGINIESIYGNIQPALMLAFMHITPKTQWEHEALVSERP